MQDLHLNHFPLSAYVSSLLVSHWKAEGREKKKKEEDSYH